MKIETKKTKELFNIEKGTLQSTKNKSGKYTFITAAQEWKTHDEYTHDCEALVIAVAASGSLGRVHYVDGKFIASDLCFVLTPKNEYKDQINLKFYFALLQALSKEIVASLAKGAAKKSINKGDFGNFSIPFPPLDSQNVIAEQGNAVEKLAKDLENVVSGVVSDTSKLRSLIAKSVKNDSTNYKLSDLLTRRKIAEKISDDKTYKRITIKLYSKGIELRDEARGVYIGTKNQFTVKAGQLLLSKIDARNGAFGIVPDDCGGAIITGNFWAYDIDESKVDKKYLALLLSTGDFYRICQDASFGMTNRKYLREEVFLTQFLSIPNLDEQKVLLDQITKLEKLEWLAGKVAVNSEEIRTRHLFSMLQKLQSAPVSQSVRSLVLSPIQQATALVLRRYQRGEMVIAKVLYIAQSVFKAPLGINFTQQTFGPYSSEIKQAVQDGLSQRKNIFMRKGAKGLEVLALGSSGNYVLNQVSEEMKKSMNDYLDKMMPHYFSSDSHSIELLATICKIIEDEKTSDDTVIRQKLQEWKPGRFQDSETYRTISFIKKNKWDQKILQI